MSNVSEISVNGVPFVGTEGLNFSIAKKTKPIKVKPLNSIFNDFSVLPKFLLNTIEGNSSLKTGSILCLGEIGEPWLQDKKNIIKKYNLVDFNEDGWITCNPKPENEVKACEISSNFCVFAHYGEDHVVNGESKKVLFGKSGDFMLSSVEDSSDIWIVNRNLFLSTYEMVK